MAAKPIKSLELNYTMIQFLLIIRDIYIHSAQRFSTTSISKTFICWEVSCKLFVLSLSVNGPSQRKNFKFLIN